MSDAEMKGVNTIFGITNVIRQFPPGRKMGVVRAFLQVAMECGLTAGIVDAVKDFGVKPPEDPEILEIARSFCEYDGSDEAMDRMQAGYKKYKESGQKK
jgi:cobalamin-dependent methionine synthase I